MSHRSGLLREPTRSFSALELKAEVNALMSAIERGGAHVYLPRADRDYAIEVGLRMLTLRHLVREEAGLYRAHEGELPVLRYYALSIAHLCPTADARRAGGADTAPAWPEAA